MVLGKIFRVTERSDAAFVSYVVEHRNDPSESLLLQNQAFSSLTPEDTDQWKSKGTLVADVYGCLGAVELPLDDDVHSLYLVFVSGCISIGKIHQTEIFRITDTLFIALNGSSRDAERVQDLRKLLNSGAFYFSWSAKGKPIDLTLAPQRQLRTKQTDNRFFWNKLMFTNFVKYNIDTNKWLLKTMCGSVVISTAYAGQHQLKTCLISRLSCERVGTRYNVRGVNDDGQVANFVETEQSIFLDDMDTRFSSYLIVRGSVPLFWEQPGVNVGSHKIRLSRGSELTQPAYDKHLLTLKKGYGKLAYINLLGSKEGEAMLSKTFLDHHQTSSLAKDVPFVSFDYHAQCPKGKQDNLRKKLLYDINKQLNDYGIMVGKYSEKLNEYGLSDSWPMDSIQNGCFRVNCVDCLDRTNSVQTFIGLWILQKQLAALKLDDKPQVVSRIEEVFRNMWIQNGDQISRIYAGTGALEGKNKLKDGTLSVARTIQNNLLDTSKQEGFDLMVQPKSLPSHLLEKARCLLPRHYLHLSRHLVKDICDRYLDFTETRLLTAVVGTWNVNGGKNLGNVQYKKSDPLADWLINYRMVVSKPQTPNIMDLSLEETINIEAETVYPDLYAIGLEEIVDLNASNIVSASTTNQREFLVDFQHTISKRCSYVLLTSTQLVGVCLYVFVRPHLANRIRDVHIDQVKTGLGGAAGNKGAVAIRLQLDATRLVFICSHFAAGQNHVEERNSDYSEISRKINFNIGSTLSAHDYIFWCGDFNYRIDLGNEEARSLAQAGDIAALFEHDQLHKEQQDGKIFHDYLEGNISFLPTYKYDSFSNDYDTSEKCRIPAWTDRILFKKQTPTRKSELSTDLDYGTIVHYGRAELKTSDHRPVIAEFLCELLTVNVSKRDQITEHVLREGGPSDCVLIIAYEASNRKLSLPLIQHILHHMQHFGYIGMYRWTGDQLWIIYKDHKHAANAHKNADLRTIDDQLQIRLSPHHWFGDLTRLTDLTTDNLVCICDHEEINPNVDFFSTSIGPSCDPDSFCIDEDAESPVSPRDSGEEEDDTSGSDPPVRPGQPDSVGRPPIRPPLPSRPGRGMESNGQKFVANSDSKSQTVKLVPVRPPPPSPINCFVQANHDTFHMSPPTMPAPPLPALTDDLTCDEQAPVPPPRSDSFERPMDNHVDHDNYGNMNCDDDDDDGPILSPWQTLPPAPPTPPIDYQAPPPPIPSRPMARPVPPPSVPPPALPVQSNPLFIPNVPPPNIPPPPLPAKSFVSCPLSGPVSGPPTGPPSGPPTVPQRRNPSASVGPQIPTRIKPLPKN